MSLAFSIVMSVYKNDKLLFLKDSISSVLNQTVKPSELLIVLDGKVPTDILMFLNNIQQQEEIIKLIQLECNAGLANALNVGVRKSKFDIIARMDADDICLEDRFEKQISFMLDNDYDVIGGQIIGFGEDLNDLIPRRKVPSVHSEIIENMKYRASFNHPTVLFKKTAFELVGGYNINIFPEDHDFFVRLSLKGCKMGNIDDCVLYYRMGKDPSAFLKRRHGFSFAKNEFKLLKNFYKIGFLSKIEFLKNVILKIPIRVMPFPIFKWIYMKLAK